MEDTFPILRDWVYKKETRHYEPPFTSVPWTLVEAHRSQCRRNHAQSPETLASRGGLAPLELVAVLQDKLWRELEMTYSSVEDVDKAFAVIEQAVHAWQESADAR